MGRSNREMAFRPRLWAWGLQHPLAPISGETPGAGSAALAIGAASSCLPQTSRCHKEEHQLRAGMKCPGGRTSSRQTDLTSLWAWFNCFKTEMWAQAQNTEPNSLTLVQAADACELFAAGPCFLSPGM